MSLADARNKLKAAAALETSSTLSRLPAARVLPGGAVVAKEASGQKPLRREASAWRIEKGVPQAILNTFRREQNMVERTHQIIAVKPSASDPGLLTQRSSTPLMHAAEMQSFAFQRMIATTSAKPSFEIADAAGLRISKQREIMNAPGSQIRLTGLANAVGGNAFPVSTPSNRSEAIKLSTLLDSFLEHEAGGWDEKFKAYDQTFAETILQVANHCAERGELLQRIRKFYLIVKRCEREAQDAARRAREDAAADREAERLERERADKLETEKVIGQQKLDALRAGMVRLKMLRAIHGRKLLAAEARAKELARENERLRAELALEDEARSLEAPLDSARPQESDRGGAGRGRRARAPPASSGGGANRRGSTSGVDLLAQQLEEMRRLLAEKDAQLDAMENVKNDAEMQLKASDQEVNALMAGISTSANRTGKHIASSSKLTQQVQGQAAQMQDKLVGMSSELGSLQGSEQRAQHQLQTTSQERDSMANELEKLRMENKQLKTQARWLRGGFASRGGGLAGVFASSGNSGRNGEGAEAGANGEAGVGGNGGIGAGGGGNANGSGSGSGGGNGSGGCGGGGGNGSGASGGGGGNGGSEGRAGRKGGGVGGGSVEDGGHAGGGGKAKRTRSQGGKDEGEGDAGRRSRTRDGDGGQDDNDSDSQDEGGGKGRSRGRSRSSTGVEGDNEDDESSLKDGRRKGGDIDEDDSVPAGFSLGRRKRERVVRKRIIRSLKGGKPTARWMCFKLVGTLMQARIEYEKETQGRSDEHSTDFGEFVEDRFVELYGKGKVAHDNLRDFIKGLKMTSKTHKRLNNFRVLTGIVPGDDKADVSVTESCAQFYKSVLTIIMEVATNDHMIDLKGQAFWSHYAKPDVMRLSLLYYEKVYEKLKKRMQGKASRPATPYPDQSEKAVDISQIKYDAEAVRAVKSFEATLQDYQDGTLPDNPEVSDDEATRAKIFEYGEAGQSRGGAKGSKTSRICVDCFLDRLLDHWTAFEILEEDQLVSAFGSWDLNGDGNLELEEFSTMIKHANPGTTQKKITRAFIAASGGDSDYVDKARLASALLTNGLTLLDMPKDFVAKPSELGSVHQKSVHKNLTALSGDDSQAVDEVLQELGHA